MSIYTSAYPWAPQVEALTRLLVAVPSVVGTPGESACARAIVEWLSALPYYQKNPFHLLLEQTTDDTLERYNVIALVRGQNAPEFGAPTTMLMGHLDTVDIGDYGSQIDMACRPDLLESTGEIAEGWLAGRGSLDMKSGVAAHLAVLERFAAGDGDQDRCLLLVITPDEEDTSKGILSVAAALPEMASRWGLNLRAAINADYTAPRFPGDPSRYIYTGSIGKLLPSLFVAGLETHAGEPFSGFDPNWLTAEVTRRVDYNPDLSEKAYGEVTPPPVSLKQTDLKEQYTVQTALASWAYYNWFTLLNTPAEVLYRFRELVVQAFDDLQREFTDRATRHGALSGTPAHMAMWQPAVYTFDELSAIVADRVGPQFQQEIGDRLMLQPGMDLRTFSCRMTEELWRAAGLSAPAAVVGYAQIYSSPVHLAPDAPMQQTVRHIAEAMAQESGINLHVRHFFPYISDMSFLGCPDGTEALAVLAKNSPGWGRLYRVDHAAHAQLDLPVINIGPWGEGAHTRRERVEKEYSFSAVPELIWRVAGHA
jgi:arginine utilization protein RocB